VGLGFGVVGVGFGVWVGVGGVGRYASLLKLRHENPPERPRRETNAVSTARKKLKLGQVLFSFAQKGQAKMVNNPVGRASKKLFRQVLPRATALNSERKNVLL